MVGVVEELELGIVDPEILETLLQSGAPEI
jgi:hypothetical protein